MPILQTMNLDQGFGGRNILSDINLSIEPNEVFVIIGPTGSGKTTLIRLLDMLDRPTGGQLVFFGTDVTFSRPLRLAARRRIAYVQQKPLVFTMSVFDNVACGLRWRQEKKEVITEKVESVLRLVGMLDYRERSAKTLSGGETQRVAVARALVTEPEVLLLDEPTANLDPISVTKIEEVLGHVIDAKRTTLVMATHDMSQGQRLADRIGVMVAGRLVQIGKPHEIFMSPETREVAEFVGMDNILPGIVTGKDGDLATISVHNSTIEAVTSYPDGEMVLSLIRPEDITLTVTPAASSARNTFKGNIVQMVSLKPLIRIEIDCGFPLLVLITQRSSDGMGLSIGKTVYCNVKASAVSIIKRWTY